MMGGGGSKTLEVSEGGRGGKSKRGGGGGRREKGEKGGEGEQQGASAAKPRQEEKQENKKEGKGKSCFLLWNPKLSQMFPLISNTQVFSFVKHFLFEVIARLENQILSEIRSCLKN